MTGEALKAFLEVTNGRIQDLDHTIRATNKKLESLDKEIGLLGKEGARLVTKEQWDVWIERHDARHKDDEKTTKNFLVAFGSVVGAISLFSGILLLADKLR